MSKSTKNTGKAKTPSNSFYRWIIKQTVPPRGKVGRQYAMENDDYVYGELKDVKLFSTREEARDETIEEGEKVVKVLVTVKEL